MQHERTNQHLGPTGQHVGKGPKNYRRTDERIHEDVCDHLLSDGSVDATDIEVKVKEGCVYLEGTVPARSMKRFAEDVAYETSGVVDVENRLRVRKAGDAGAAYLPDDLQ